MTDLSALRETIDYWHETDFQAKAETTGLSLHGDQVLDFARSIAAARLLLRLSETGQTIRWCEVHRQPASQRWPDDNWVCRDGLSRCPVVVKVLIDPIETS